MNQILNKFPEIPSQCATIVDILRDRSCNIPGTQAFTFLEDGETQELTLTYHELDRRSRAVAAQLQALGLSGERAILLYPPGLDYLIAFFGCLYAGVVAIPAYPPSNQRKTPRIQAISIDAQASIALTTTAMLPTLQSILTLLTKQGNFHWLTTDNIAQGIEDSWQQPAINADTLAFLQYTSGSTGTPKGVMLSHGNLLHNAAVTYQLMEHSPSSKFVSWLPVYHDMGLIGGILQPLYGGFPCILMSPASFLQRPYRWLQAISHYKGTTSGGPNFAYELCVQRITQEQKETLDLSSWSVAFNGAEPVRRDTLEQFATTFAECGFRAEAFYPCYGMAEATLIVSGGIKTALAQVKTVDKSALSQNQIVEKTSQSQDIQSFVSCGETIPQQQIVIVNPETLTRCSSDEVGEIWISGLSVGKGYWNRTQETEQTFHAYLKDTKEGPFLRTSDLGFLDNDELFITGRAKDLIIIRGRNLYPQDIELSAERSHPSLRFGANAAFTVEINNEERLVVVQELEFRAKPNLAEVASAIRQAIAQEHEVQVYAVVLIKPGSIPKTSSGKIQRRATRTQFENGELSVIESDILKISDIIARKETQLQRSELLALSPRECQPILESYLIELLAGVLSIATDDINPQEALSTLGLDSLKVFELKNRIEVDLEVEVSVADFFEGMSTRSLITKILAQMTKEAFIPSKSLSQVQPAEVYPLSFAQQRLWFLDRLEPGNPAYNISLAVNLQGELEVTLLERSLNEIIRRHETLRTTFTTVNGQPVQIIASSLKLSLSVINIESQSDVTVQQFLTQESQRPFELTQGPLLRAKLLRLAQQEHILLLEMHHIISDGWSTEVFLQEIGLLYKAFLTRNTSPLTEISIQYKDFAHWQRQWLQGEILQSQLSYWKQQLEGIPVALKLPTDRPRPTVQTSHGAQQSIELSEAVIKQLKAIARQEGVTVFMLLLAAFQTFLYRYTGQDDIAVGTPVANRNRDEVKGLIGFFVNTLVLRTDMSGNPTFDELLTRVKKVALGAYTHQDLPFDQLVEAVQPERDTSRTPLFQVMFNVQDYSQLPEMPGLALSLLKIETETAQFDLSLSIEITEQEVAASFYYNTDLFDTATINRMLRHFQNLLSGIVANSQARLSDLPLLSAADCQELLQLSRNQSPIPNSSEQFIHQLFEAQVERTPDAIAVVFQNQHLTYRELNQRANQVAHHLRSLGVGPEVLVGICIQRSLEMAIGLLAILKAGGAYVPLDPAYPKERLALILRDSQVSVLLTQQSLVATLPALDSQVVCLDTNKSVIAEESQENLINQTQPENLVYIIYTSGSTGTPKGVTIQHRSLASYAEIACLEYGLEASDRVLQFASISFDAAAEEIFPCLICGATLILRTDEMLSSTPQFLQHCRDWGITVLDLPTAFWHQVTAELATANLVLPDSLRLAIIGGERANRKHLTTWQQQVGQRVRLVNTYGPTETTIVATLCDLSVSTADEVPIGKAIPQVQTYVLDPDLQLVPVGTPGELYIGGVGVARGYFKRSDLTAAKFIPNPYSSKPGERLYQTGDLVRYLPDGNLEFLGRIDHQVKIRGFRIELGEIEALLNQHPGVQEAVVVAHNDDLDHQRLIAYVVGQYQLETVETLDTQQTLQWQTVFDSLYKKFDATQNSGFYIKGWESSYTGASIADEEVREWMEQTIGRILALQPNRVLEIGCGGSGLMLLNIAPHCQQYWATDPSENALQILQQQLDTLEQPLAGVTLSQRSALDFEDVPENSFDAVLIVSVAQYFPSIDYLLQVLEKAVNVVEPGGFIFLGDVRSLPLLEAFHASVQLYRAADTLSRETLQQRVQKQLFEEKQLVIDPAFFTALKQHLPKISHVDILLERGSCQNELTKFRYDVVLHLDDKAVPTMEIPWLDWNKQEVSLCYVRQMLEETAPQFLGLSGVPNARAIADIQLVQWLKNSETPETVGEMKQVLSSFEDQGVEPEVFWALEKDFPYLVQITWSGNGAGDRYDVIFKRSTPNPARCFCLPAAVPPLSRPWQDYANTPWQGSLARERVPQLRDFLREKLPEYMVPTAFIFLDALPLTPNGKVNRRALPLPESYSTQNQLYVAPKTELQQTIANTWQTVLGIEKVSINDNFFDLGGHSLLISQVNAQLREKLQRDISVVEMFQYPSISLLAKHLSQEQQEQHSFKEIHNRSEKQKLALNRQKQTRNPRK